MNNSMIKVSYCGNKALKYGTNNTVTFPYK